MSSSRFTEHSLLAGVAVTIFATATLSAAPAWAGDCCSKSSGGSGHGSHGTANQHAGHQHAGHQKAKPRPTTIVTHPPHGGQVYATNFQYFEVVYLPNETRVYPYGIDQRPTSAKNVQGQITMQVRGNPQVYRYPLAPVAGGEEYLASVVDVSRIRDGDMTVTVQLGNLPYQQQPQVYFTQTFAMTQARPAVTVAGLTQADQDGITRQQVCPVTGGPLGSMGTPVKLMVGNQPVYLCCQGCVDKVHENPAKFVTPPGITRQPVQASTGSQLTVATATAADQAAIQAQGVCPVTNGRLGSMGTPIKLTRGGQSLYLCCQGCVPKVEKAPDYYFAQPGLARTGG